MLTLSFSRGLPWRPYTPLCILGVPRCGSNLLRTLLSDHPQILVHDEVFGIHAFTRNKAPAWNDRQRVPYTGGSYRDYLIHHVFPEESGGNSVIGCKLFPEHLTHAPEGGTRVWRMIRAMPKLKCIVLNRENLLDVVLSHELANRNNRWQHYGDDPELYAPIRIEYDSLTQQIDDILSQYAAIGHMVRGCDLQYITYTDLTERTVETMTRLQRWLGLDVHPVSTDNALRKQRRQSRADVVLNLRELHRQCEQEHPEWLRYFNEPEHFAEVTASATMPL